MQTAQPHAPPAGAPPPPPPSTMQPVAPAPINGTNDMAASHGQVAAANMQHTQYQPQPQQYQHQPPPQHHQHHAPAPPPPVQHHAPAPPPPAQHHHQYQQPPPQQHQPPPHHAPAPPPPQHHHQHQQHHAPAPPPPQQHQQQPPPPQQQQQQQQHPPQQHYQQPPPPQQVQTSYGQPPPPMQPGQPQQQPPPQQQAPPQQHHYPHQGLNGGWQSDKDYQERRKMIAKIVHLLQQRKPNAPQEWLKKLPQMAKRLEESLYRSAKSFEQYNDASTLKHRLQQLAVNIGMKTKKMQQAQIAQQKLQQPPPPRQYQQQQAQYRPPPATQQPPQQLHRPPAPQPVQARPPAPQQPIQQRQQPMQQPPPVPQAPAPQPPQQAQQRMVNVAEINPIMGGPPPSQPPQHVQPAPSQPPTAPPPHGQPIQYHPQPAPAPPPAAPAPQPPAPGQNGVRPPAGTGGRQVSDRQQVLRHQQQRLLLLRHAAKCQHEDGRCPVTPHCAGMKRLWKHIAECKDQKCLVPHCVSSRYVLSHYHRCKDVRCPVCGPVREAIHRSHEKQKQMQALKQRHQQAVQQTQIQAAPAPSSAPAPVAPAAPLPPQPLSSGPVAAPMAHTSIAPVGSSVPEPPNKRQKTASGVPAQPYPPPPPQPGVPVAPQQPMHQPSSVPPGVPPPSQYQYPPQPGAPVPVPVQQPQPAVAVVPVPGAQPPAVPSAPAGPKPAVSGAPGIAFQNGQVITPKYTGPKPQEDHTLINCFSVAQIETHIASLNKGLRLPPQKLKAKCLDVLKSLQSHQHGWVFNSPVDPVELGLPDYFEVIKRPMDLGTIRKKLENGCYHSLDEFENHCHLTFDNAMLYNPQGSVVYNMAEEMKAKFEQDYQNLLKVLNAEEDVKRRNGEACVLCGCEKLIFEPPVFYCNGLNCPSKRIRRNSYYYVGANNQYHWCHQCYQELKDNQAIELGDVTIKKEGLTKKKNDEVHEESWVQCDRCERWIHQICALFNTRQNKDQRSEYACPRCTIEERRKKGELEATSQTPMAEDLPRTKLSEYLEENVRKKVNEYVDVNSKQKAEAEQIPLEEARKALEMGGHITIRQVTSMDRKLEVRERMKRRYAFKNYPDEFNFRCKCIVVFQNLDGVDVILFGLYVYEHDEKNALPNKRTVYISYLDSVHYMRPRKMRTFIYHEILVSYLDYVRKRGFSSAHIWACPPLKGDDYILYAKPEDQKVPKDDRLRQWYIDMLVESQKRGIVGTVTNMYDLFFSNEKNDATVVPYMDGDYFPAEVENIIKDIEEGKTGKKGKEQGKKKKGNNKAKQKKKNGRGGTRSTGLDEQALKASGFVPPGTEAKSVEEGGRDYVMVKLGETIQPMKESFIVAFLAWEGAKREHMVVPKEIEEYRKEHGIVSVIGKDDSDDECKSLNDGANGKTPPVEKESEEKKDGNDTFTNGDVKMESADGSAVKQEETDGSPPPTDQAEKPASADATTNSSTAAVKEEKPDEAMPDAGANDTAAKDGNGATQPEPEKPADAAAAPAADQDSAQAPAPDQPPAAVKTEPGTEDAAGAPEAGVQQGVSQSAMAIRKGKFAAMTARKRDLMGKDKEPEKDDKDAKDKDKEKEKKASKTIYVKDSRGRTVKVIDDDDEEMDCEFLNNRQAFLNLCQGNHYQFDHLRRAKHSSMMVLWHLHNRDAPKFVQQCATCSREILTGYRFHCPTCADFDQCQECVHNPKVARHPHQLKPIPVASGQQPELTEEQRKERQRSIQLHMTLLQHAATCTSPKCPSANCTKMKGLLKHGAQCQIKATGGCNVCKRIWALLQIHARQCRATSCPVPNCMAIRERVRQLKKQQQAMDDRRRLQMNQAYSASSRR